ncbi:MAG TPA: TetR/AcrR family transcriptional regulator [Aliidongia sp.]|nr:TetR/AcrR family transcriptional regulator [Aliidongia sp.]
MNRDRYHHGNLRDALIDAALGLIAERGPTGFTFAEAARQVGVSPAAPYRHFRDREALVAEVARRGFDLFEAALRAGWNDGKPEPLGAMIACGRAYLAFVRRYPSYYAAMFGSDQPAGADPAFQAAGERAFGVLKEAAEMLCGRCPAEVRPPALMVALHLWSMTHGIASLFLGRPDGPRRMLPMAPEELLEAEILIYTRSLGLDNLPS